MRIVFKGYDEKTRLRDESLFSVSNGYIGVRGCFEEGSPVGAETIRGTYMAGVYDSVDYDYGDINKNNSLPNKYQKMVNLPDAQGINIYVAGKKVSCNDKEARDIVRILDMENGYTKREFDYKTSINELHITFTRLASFVRPEIFAIKCKVDNVKPENGLIFSSTLVTNASNSYSDGIDDNLYVIDENINFVHVRTKNTEINVYVAVAINKSEDEYTKFVAFSKVGKNDALIRAKEACEDGFENLLLEQRKFLDDFWKKNRVIIKENDTMKKKDDEISMQTKIDFSIYELFSLLPREHGLLISSRGLTGNSENGNNYWENIVFNESYLNTISQELSKLQIDFRYETLDLARMNAKKLGFNEGALYPYETLDGSENSLSEDLHLHINADIARIFIKYFNSTFDINYLPKICEVLTEISRLYIALSKIVNRRYSINSVTGPDKFKSFVNNNYYTNAGATYVLENTYRLCKLLKENNPRKYDTLAKKIDINDKEIEQFYDMYELYYFPYDRDENVIMQDDSFTYKFKKNISNISKKDKLNIKDMSKAYLHSCALCQIPEVLLSNVYYKKEDYGLMKKSFDYYESITLNDLPITDIIFAISASFLGIKDKAEIYFKKALDIDLYNIYKDTGMGLHVAVFGGIYMVLINGFAGLSFENETISFNPSLPSNLAEINFNVSFRGKLFNVIFANNGYKFTLISGEPFYVYLYGEKVKVNK